MNNILLVSTLSFEKAWAYYPLAVLDALKGRGIKIFFIYMEGNTTLEKLIPEEIHIIRISKSKTFISKLAQKIYPLEIKQIIHKTCINHNISLIHFLSPDFIVAPIIPFLQKRYNIIYTVHDVIPHNYKSRKLKERIFILFLNYRTKKCIKYSSILATNSSIQVKQLNSLYPNKTIYYFRMPSHISKTIKNGMDICPEIVSLTKPYILFFGNIHYYKGIDLLIKAYSESKFLNNIILVIAGAGTYKLHTQDNPNIIAINRHINDSEIRNLFCGASCVVYPYFSITQTAVVQFPYYFGIPVIASDLEYFKNCIIDGKTGFLFPSGDYIKLMNLLEFITKESFDIELMKKKQFDLYEKEYSNNGLYEELILMYNSINKF